jgi:hypothetical protein
MTLKRQMRRLGAFAAIGPLIGWSSFVLLSTPLDPITTPLLWFGVVVALASVLAGSMVLYYRVKNRV